jgi:diguanylate cyclase (GGDEF)-like protein/PAS domain S-box-containing protein
MFHQFKNWIAPPTFPGDEIKTRRASLLNITLLAAIVLVAVILFGNALGGKTPALMFVLNCVSVALYLALWFTLRAGKVTLVGIGLITLATFSITLSIITLGTIRTPTTTLYLILIVCAGLLFDFPGTLATAILCSLLVLGLISAESANLLPPADFSVSITQWITHVVIFAFAGMLSLYWERANRIERARACQELDERKRAENALRESEARWKFALEGSGDAIWDWNAQTNSVYFSRQWKAIQGYAEDEIADSLDEWQKHIHPDDREFVYAEINKHLARQTPVYTSEHRILCKDGTYKWVLDRGKVISWTSDHKPLRVIGTHSDITERKRAEEQLRESEAKFRCFVEQSAEGFTLIDEQGNVVEWNRMREEATGWTRAQVIGKKFWDVHSQMIPPEKQMPDLDSRHKQIILSALQNGTSPMFDRPIEAQTVKPNGERRFSRETIFPIKTERGFWIGSVSHDMTEDKKAEAALRASEERYRTLFENLPIPVFTKDLDGRYTSCNAEDLKYWNTNPVGHTDAELLPSANALAFRDADEQVLQKNSVLDIEEQWVTPIGSRTMLARKVPLRDIAENIIGILGVSVDITERKQLEQELQAQHSFAMTVMNHMGQGLTITNKQGHFEFVNPAYAQLIGYDPAELIGKRPRDVTMPMAQTELVQAHQDRLDRKTSTYESQLIHKDGRNIPVLVTGVPRPTTGAYAGSITVITDLTERKRAEEELRAREELYHQMFANHSAVMLLINPTSGAIVDANLAAAAFYGYSLDTLRQMKIDQINSSPQHLVEQVHQEIFSRRQNYFVFSHRLASGELRDVEIYSVPIQAQKHIVLYSIIHDITARRQAESQLLHLSTHDGLTGLYNRAFFESEFMRLEKGREFPLSIIIADVDNMKTTNDTLGHIAGDGLLKRTAELFCAMFRTSDIIARIGGDEFAILLPQTDAVTAEHISARVQAKLAQANAEHTEPLLQLSLGVATAKKGNLLEAFKSADARMYADKHQHKQGN